MQRLSIRAYKPIGQGESWALVGISDNPEKVEKWILEYSGSGLIFHTGFTVLPREVLLELLPRAYEGIVYCAATKAIMGLISPYFRLGSQLCRGLNEDDTATVSVMQDWFFFSPTAPISQAPKSKYQAVLNCLVREPNEVKTEDQVLSEVSEGQGLNQTQSQDAISLHCPIDHEGFDVYLSKLVEGKPELEGKLIGAKVTTVATFHENWLDLEPEDAYTVASFLMKQAQSPHRHLFGKELSTRKKGSRDPGVMAEAIIKIASFMPAWDYGLPSFTARLDNIIKSWGVKRWWDFANLNAKQILHTPNLGLKTLNSLFEYMVTYAVHMPDGTIPVSGESVIVPAETAGEDAAILGIPFYTLGNAPTLIEALDLLINGYSNEAQSKKEGNKDAAILKDRLRGLTLAEIGGKLHLTREAIRQKAARCLRDITRRFRLCGNSPTYMWPLAGLANLVNDCFKKETCSQIDFSNFVKIFSQTMHWEFSITQVRILQDIFSQKKIGFIITNLANKKVLLPVPSNLTQENLDELISAQADVPSQISGLAVRDGLTVATRVFMQTAENEFLSSLLAMDMVYSRAVIDNQGNLSYPNSVPLKETAISEVLRILRIEGNPLHGTKELYTRMPEAYRNAVSERRLAGHIEEYQSESSPESPDYIFSMGRGKYGLWENMGIDDEHGRQCAQFVEKHVNQNPVRQFSDKDLYDILTQAGMVSWKGDRVDRVRAVSVILMRYRPEKVRYMGRFIWAAGPWTDERDTSGRYQIQDLVATFVKAQGKPVTKEQIDEYVRQYRGRGIGDQYFEHHGLIRLRGTGKNTLYWHESLDPEPFDSLAVQNMKQEILTIIRNCEAMFMGALKADIIQNSDIASKFNAMQFLAVLLRLPEVTVYQNDQKKIVVQASENFVTEIEQ